MNLKNLLTLGLLALIYPLASSAEMPWSGTLVGQESGDILDFRCQETSFDRIRCDFTQVLLSPNKDEEDWFETLALLEADTDEAEYLEVFCGKEFQESYKFIIDGMPDDISGYSTDLSDFARTASSDVPFFERFAELGLQFCISRDRQYLVPLLRHIHERERVTCSPYINNYTQEFVKTSPTLWTVDSQPEGSCGAINTSYFYQEKSSDFLWNLVSQKVITNKSGTAGLISCSDLDEDPTHYLWNGSAKFIGCTYID